MDRLHSVTNAADTHFPEERMFSVTQAMNAGREGITEGLCRLADATDVYLKDVIKENPKKILGKSHTQVWGHQMRVLIKLIDSAERLTPYRFIRIKAPHKSFFTALLVKRNAGIF